MFVVLTTTQWTAALASTLYDCEYLHIPYASTGGASGWLFGLIGYGIGGWHNLGPRGAMMKSFFWRWAMYGFVFGIMLGANNAAHAGGLAGGYVLGLIPAMQGPHRFPWNRFWITGAWISAVIWAVTLGFMALSIITQWNVEP